MLKLKLNFSRKKITSTEIVGYKFLSNFCLVVSLMSKNYSIVDIVGKNLKLKPHVTAQDFK